MITAWLEELALERQPQLQPQPDEGEDDEFLDDLEPEPEPGRFPSNLRCS